MHTRFLRQLMGLIGLSFIVQAASSSPAPNTVSACLHCHGQEQNRDTRIPKLAGQYQDFIVKQISDYRDQRRSGHPTDLLPLSDQAIMQIASYYQQLPIRASVSSRPLSLGKSLYLQGDASRGVKQCANCHGSDGMGRSPEISMFPVLAGQNKPYIIQAMREYREAQRKNDVSGMMTYASRNLSDEDIEAMADYLAGLRGAGSPPTKDSAKRTAPSSRPELRGQSRANVINEAHTESANADTPTAVAQRQDADAAPAPSNERKSTHTQAKASLEPAVKEKPAKPALKTATPVNQDEKNKDSKSLAAEEAELLARQIFNEEQPRSKATEHGRRKAIACEVCHGKSGVSVNKHYPSLTGISREQMVQQLQAYKDGRRINPVMQEVTRTLSTSDIQDIASYFASRRR